MSRVFDILGLAAEWGEGGAAADAARVRGAGRGGTGPAHHRLQHPGRGAEGRGQREVVCEGVVAAVKLLGMSGSATRLSVCV